MIERVGGQPGAEAIEGVDENLARILVLDLVILELERRDPAADTDFHPPIAQVIEHGDLLDQPQRRIEREQIDQRAEPHAPGRARYRAEIDAGHRHHVERRGVVLRHVQAVDAGLVGRLHKGEPLVEERCQRAICRFDVIEKSDLHGVSSLPIFLTAGMSRAASASTKRRKSG